MEICLKLKFYNTIMFRILIEKFNMSKTILKNDKALLRKRKINHIISNKDLFKATLIPIMA